MATPVLPPQTTLASSSDQIALSETDPARQHMGHFPDTPQGQQPDGFSVHRPRHCRDSPKALPAPYDVSRCVLIAVQHEPAVRADMRAHTQACLNTLASCPAGSRAACRAIREAKAACAGRPVSALPPASTSQDCSGVLPDGSRCTQRVAKSLSVRTHVRMSVRPVGWCSTATRTRRSTCAGPSRPVRRQRGSLGRA
jgi:hypothetical protein